MLKLVFYWIYIHQALFTAILNLQFFYAIYLEQVNLIYINLCLVTNKFNVYFGVGSRSVKVIQTTICGWFPTERQRFGWRQHWRWVPPSPPNKTKLKIVYCFINRWHRTDLIKWRWLMISVLPNWTLPF